MCGVCTRAAQNGFRVVRMFGFPVQEGFNLQTSAGVFNPLALKGLDIAVAEAAKNNLRLVVALMNNWNYNPLQTDWKCAFPFPSLSSRGYMHYRNTVICIACHSGYFNDTRLTTQTQHVAN